MHASSISMIRGTTPTSRGTEEATVFTRKSPTGEYAPPLTLVIEVLQIWVVIRVGILASARTVRGTPLQRKQQQRALVRVAIDNRRWAAGADVVSDRISEPRRFPPVWRGER